MTVDIRFLTAAVGAGAAFRRISRLQPVGGKGDKIFPPTYPGARNNDPPRHVFERRRIEGEEVWCVLIDSVQSQANRLEGALLRSQTERNAASLYRFPTSRWISEAPAWNPWIASPLSMPPTGSMTPS